jgi:hypothetical protein
MMAQDEKPISKKRSRLQHAAIPVLYSYLLFTVAQPKLATLPGSTVAHRCMSE